MEIKNSTAQKVSAMDQPEKTKKRRHVAVACVNCKISHVACDNQRPCRRCVITSKADTCVDIKHRRRGRPPQSKNGPCPPTPESVFSNDSREDFSNQEKTSDIRIEAGFHQLLALAENDIKFTLVVDAQTLEIREVSSEVPFRPVSLVGITHELDHQELAMFHDAIKSSRTSPATANLHLRGSDGNYRLFTVWYRPSEGQYLCLFVRDFVHQLNKAMEIPMTYIPLQK